MTDKLKPCPFCGGEADTEWHHGYYGVRCESCYAEVTADGMNDTIEAWNTRKPMDRIVEQLEKEKSDWNDDYNVPINNAIAIVQGVRNYD